MRDIEREYFFHGQRMAAFSQKFLHHHHQDDFLIFFSRSIFYAVEVCACVRLIEMYKISYDFYVARRGDSWAIKSCDAIKEKTDQSDNGQFARIIELLRVCERLFVCEVIE